MFTHQIAFLVHLFELFLTQRFSALNVWAVEQIFVSRHFECEQEPLHLRKHFVIQDLLELVFEEGHLALVVEAL